MTPSRLNPLLVMIAIRWGRLETVNLVINGQDVLNPGEEFGSNNLSEIVLDSEVDEQASFPFLKSRENISLLQYSIRKPKGPGMNVFGITAPAVVMGFEYKSKLPEFRLP